jgi:hypothetical protein
MRPLDPIEEARHDIDARFGVVDLSRAIARDVEAKWKSDHAAQSHEASPPGGPSTTLGEIVDRLDERAFGVLMILLCLPCIPPFIYILPQIVSVPMMALSLQMAAGRQSPWMPSKFRDRRFDLTEFNKALDSVEKYLRWLEKIARPRFPAITGRLGARIAGGLMTIPAFSVMLPLVGANTAPSIGMTIASLGFIQRDGLFVIAGLVISLGWVILFATVILLFGVEALSIARAWILERF